MKRRQYLFVVALAVVAGLVGGALYNRVFVAEPAVAQDSPAPIGDIDEMLKDAVKELLLYKKVISAEGFRLVKDGKEFGRFAVSPNGIPELLLFDKNGNERVVLKVEQGLGAELALGGKPGSGHRAGIYTLSDGNSGLYLCGKDSLIPRIKLWMSSGGVPTLALYDGNFKPRVTLGNAELEGASVGAVRNRSEYSLVLFDKDGTLVWSAP
jgi:hypothetical protein